MNVKLEGNLNKSYNGNICGNYQFTDEQELKIEITPYLINVTFPEGLAFKNFVDYQKELYYWVGLKPTQYRLKTEENTTIIEIDLPPPDCKFRLEMGKENLCWAGFETRTTRYLKRYSLIQ
ncbi:hypothetical protein [Methanospirillum hungatei]|uniref:hypothetical protein n=1 Tax=Methanospirillum hungatei TaxID=2203 RepID=UPI00005DFFB0|nr:hypothetical protein [Methanospirillum hungatei]